MFSMHLSNHLFFFLQITLQQAYCLSFSLALSYQISKSFSTPYIFHYSPSLYDSLYLKLSVYRFLYMNLSLFTTLRSNPYNHSPIIVYQPSSIPSSSLASFHMYNTFILITHLSATLIFTTIQLWNIQHPCAILFRQFIFASRFDSVVRGIFPTKVNCSLHFLII